MDYCRCTQYETKATITSYCNAIAEVSSQAVRCKPRQYRPLLLAALFSLTSGQVFGEVITTTTLGGAGGTDLQKRTGDAVQMVCGAFVNAGVDTSRDDVDLQTELFDKCGEMVHTANRLAGNDGPTVKDLGITQEQLQAALQNIAGEEIAAAGSIATEATSGQSNNIGKHLSNILSRSTSLQVSAVNRHGSDALFVASVEPASGAGAAADDGLNPNRFGLFINGMYGAGSKDSTDGEDGYDAAARGFTAGADYRVSASSILGVALGYSNSDTDFEITPTVSGGGLDVESNTFSAYALWFGKRFYADGIISFGSSTYDLERSILIPSTGEIEQSPDNPNDGANRTAVADTDGQQFRASFSTGMEIVSGKMTFAPYARLSMMQIDLDGYDETGAGGLNLRVQNQDIESITSAIGYRLVGVMSTGSSIISPQLSFEWAHEFSDDARDITSTYIHDPRELELLAVTDSPDRNYYTVGLGVSAVLRNRTQLYAEVKSLLDLDNVSETLFAVGARFEL